MPNKEEAADQRTKYVGVCVCVCVRDVIKERPREERVREGGGMDLCSPTPMLPKPCALHEAKLVRGGADGIWSAREECVVARRTAHLLRPSSPS